MANLRNSSYLEYVRTHSSCLGGGTVEDWAFEGPCHFEATVAHHCHIFNQGGIGTKPSDYRTVPLMATQHVELHQLGEKKYWELKRVDPVGVIIQLLATYIKDRERAFRALLDYHSHQDRNQLIDELEELAEDERRG